MQKGSNSAFTASERQRLLAMAKAGKARRTTDTRPPIARVERDRPLPLSFGQQRLLFLSQMEGLDATYHIPFSIGFLGIPDRAALGRSLDRIVERHESLRTTFLARDGESFQRFT